ncbi:MAG: beta-N-acetylglucosaminidase domain-containing protein [Kineothrix sp.]
MRVVKAMAAFLLAAGLSVLCGHEISMAAEPSADTPVQVGESPYKLQWRAGDPTSETEGRYQIYPVPQSIEYLEEESVTLPEAVTVAASDGVDQSTKNYIQEVLSQRGHTVSFTAEDGESANIRLGIKGDGGLADTAITDAAADLFAKTDAYALRVSGGKVNIVGKDTTAAFYGVATLKMMLSSLAEEQLVPVKIDDYASIPLRGIVEGFYGGFTEEQRKSEMLFCKDVKMNVFVYAAKSDNYHRGQWAELYPENMMNHFRELMEIQEETKCEFVWSVHGQHFFSGMNDSNRTARIDQMKAKFQQLMDIGVKRFALLNDDFGAGSVELVVSVSNELNAWLKEKGCKPLSYCPQGYNVSWAGNGNEMRGLSALDDDILIYWTGRDVNSPFWQDSIDYVINNSKDANDQSSHQTPIFWVNYPCNEHTQKGLLIGSAKYYLKDGITGLGGAVSNPVAFAETNKVAFFQLANYFWNVNNVEANADYVWEQTFKYLQPEVYDAYLTIARNACEAPDSGRIPGRIDESAYIQADLEAVQTAVRNDTLTGDNVNARNLLAEFVHIQEAMDDMEENCLNENLVKELANPGHISGISKGEGWLHALRNIGRAGELLVRAELELTKENPDRNVVWEYFSGAATELEQYNARTFVSQGTAGKSIKAGTKRILPFINVLLADVESYITAQSEMTEPEAPANRIFTNVSGLAETPLTIQNNEFSVRGVNGITLNVGEYVGIKKAGIAEITGFVLEGQGLDALTLEYSLHGDQWVSAEAGEPRTPVLARYVRLRNGGSSRVQVGLKKLGIRVSNEEPVMKVTSSITQLESGAWDDVLDGSMTTFVQTGRNQAVNDTITIDLGEQRPIHDITFYTEDGSRHIYYAEVAISSDGQSYGNAVGTIDDTTNGDNIVPPYRRYAFDAGGQQGRYIRLRITQAYDAKINLREVEINQSAPEYDSGRTPAQAVIGSVSYGLARAADGDTSTVYTVEAMPANAYLEYRITDNTAVEQFTVFQGTASHAAVSITDGEGQTHQLGNADGKFSIFTVPDGKTVRKIRLEFTQGSRAAIHEIGLKCRPDVSGDVGVAVENIYLDEAPEDSVQKVNLALGQPVEVPSAEGGNPAAGAVDGNTGTRWAGNSGSSGWFLVDLGVYTNIIEDISVSYYNKVYPTDYSIQVSNDRESWVTVNTGTHTTTEAHPVDTARLETPVAARYVKLVFNSFNTAAAVQNSISIKELEVNGVRRTGSMEYSRAGELSPIHAEVAETVALPELVDVTVADMEGAEYEVQVLPLWTPAAVDTSSAGVREFTAALPVTVNLDNAGGIQCIQEVRVGNVSDERNVNLALNRPVQVSAVEETAGGASTGHTGERAVDGSADTRWSSGALNERAAGQAADQWIVVDLGRRPVLIREIRAAYYNKVWPMQYRMELSNDQRSWVTVESYEREAGDTANVTDVKAFEVPVSARYLRLYFPEGQLNTQAAGGAVSIKELTVTGDRLLEPVTYTGLTDTFEDAEVGSDATVEELELPVLLNAVWRAEGAEEAEAVRILADWDTAAFEAVGEGEALLTAVPFTDAYHKNTDNLRASKRVMKRAVQTEPDEVRALQAKVEEAKVIGAEKWTADSYRRLQDKLAEAERLLEGAPTAGQAEDMLRELAAAIAGLVEKPEAPVKVFPFTDVKKIEGNWKYESVKYTYENNIMNGISGTTEFRPDHSLTRGMFATVLYRMAGEPEVTFFNKFTDVAAGKWYSDAIIWANQQKIVAGFSDGSYGVDTEITREQIAKMLYEYARACKYDVSASGELGGFTDANEVSGWAAGYMKWAAAVEMITGKPNEGGGYRLDPKGQATRAECAAMLMRFQKKYK